MRTLRGWSEEELASRLEQLEALSVSFGEEAREQMRAGDPRWQPVRSEAIVAREPPGPPLPDGPFERACELVRAYRFSDPSIVRATFDAARPLLGRRMLLEIRVLGLRYLCGTVVGQVRDERTERESVFGFRYDTLEGHIERGEEWFLVRKDHATGAIHFTIASRWQRGELASAWSRAGFAVLAGRYRRLWLRRAHARMRAMLGQARSPAGRAYLLAASAGALSGARSTAGPWTAAAAARGMPARGVARGLASRAPLLSIMALAEALADKHPRIPPRVSPVPWLGRIGAGALAGAAIASHLGRDPKAGALLGGAAAGVATKVSSRARARLAERLREPLAGLAEDVLVGALARTVASRSSPAV